MSSLVQMHCHALSHQGRASVLASHFLVIYRFANKQLCCEVVFRPASISINDNAELKVLDSDRHLFFYLTGTVMRLDEMEIQLPSCSQGCNGENSFQKSITRGPPGSTQTALESSTKIKSAPTAPPAPPNSFRSKGTS